MSSRENAHRPTDMEKDRHRADTVDENELRGSELASISQNSMNRSTFYMIYIIVIGL
jgi:hypothetical protein